MFNSLTTLALVFGLLSLIIAGYCLWQALSFNKLRKTFFAGTKGADLESVIFRLAQELRANQEQLQTLEDSLNQLKHQSTFHIQKVGLVRFNPFNDGGGNFSFSLALLDAHNTGIIITSMYGREQNRIYTKKIEVGKADSPLNEEEQRAIALANKI